MRSHTLFREFQDDQDNFEPSIGALADLLKCRADAENSVWRKRFDTLKNEALSADHNDVLAFVGICEEYVKLRRGI